MHLLTVLLLSFVLGFSADINKKWTVDPDHSTVSFQVSHFFVPVSGQFKSYEGDIIFEPDALAESKIGFTIQVASIDTDNEKRDGHLQSPDFFNSEKWPTISFKGSSFKKTGENTYEVEGNLTIRDVTKKVSLPFTILGRDSVRKGGLFKTEIMGIKMATTIRRTDYGVGVGDWAATTVIGDEVSIEIFLELNG